MEKKLKSVHWHQVSLLSSNMFPLWSSKSIENKQVNHFKNIYILLHTANKDCKVSSDHTSGRHPSLDDAGCVGYISYNKSFLWVCFLCKCSLRKTRNIFVENSENIPISFYHAEFYFLYFLMIPRLTVYTIYILQHNGSFSGLEKVFFVCLYHSQTLYTNKTMHSDCNAVNGISKFPFGQIIWLFEIGLKWT